MVECVIANFVRACVHAKCAQWPRKILNFTPSEIVFGAFLAVNNTFVSYITAPSSGLKRCELTYIY